MHNFQIGKFVFVRSMIVGFALLFAFRVAPAQSAAGGDSAPRASSDSNMVFHSPRPLIETFQAREYRDAWGLDIMFSAYGFGAGVFFRHEYSESLYGLAMIEFSGVKNSGEITLYDPYTGTLLGPANKLNDIYMIPASIALQYRVFKDAIAESFRPYITLGAGPTAIIAAPDSLDFFVGIKHAAVHVAPNVYVGIGANVGKDPRALSGVSFRYYFIPYGPGIESIRGKPIKDLGGFFIMLNWGIVF